MLIKNMGYAEFSGLLNELRDGLTYQPTAMNKIDPDLEVMDEASKWHFGRVRKRYMRHLHAPLYWMRC